MPVSLQEWETRRPDPGSQLGGRNLDGSEAIRNLAQRLTERGQIEVLEFARGLELRATSFVGRFNLGDLTITIQPKLTGTPFLPLLRYAYGLRNLHLYESVEYASTKWTFQDLLLIQLGAETNELLARGVHRDYERRRAELTNPRGRIDFDRFVGIASRARAALPCVHHPRTDDTILNQVLLAGLLYASRLGNRKYKRPFWASGNVSKKQRRVHHALSGLNIRGIPLALRALPVPIPRSIPLRLVPPKTNFEL